MTSSKHRVGAQMRPIPQFIASALALVATFAVTSTAEAAPPDLRALYINGPEQVDIFQSVVINFGVLNNDPDPLASGDFTAELILVPMAPGPEVIVGTVNSSVLGLQYGVANIPDIASGAYTWKLNIQPYPGEVNTVNNVVFGQTLGLLKTDLELQDDSDIQFSADQNDVGAQVAVVRVLNVGTTDGILVFNIVENSPVSWLQVDPPSSFAAGGSGNDVTITVNHAGLDLGTYSVVLRFYNVVHNTDFKEITVTLVVGKPRFWPGNRLRGQIDSPGEVDEVVFEGVVGEKLQLRVRPQHTADIKPRLTFLDESDNVLKVLKFSNAKKWQKKTWKLTKSGTLRLQISGADGTGGVYKVRTKAKYPTLARPRQLKVSGTGADTVDVDFLAVMTGELNFSVNPNADFAGPVLLGYTTSAGSLFDLSSFTEAGFDDEQVVLAVPISKSGEGLLHISGFGPGGDPEAKIYVWPVQPPVQKIRLVLH